MTVTVREMNDKGITKDYKIEGVVAITQIGVTYFTNIDCYGDRFSILVRPKGEPSYEQDIYVVKGRTTIIINN